MRTVHWTGNPFVDAGLAALAAISNIEKLEDLTVDHLQKAAKELERVLLSDQALGIGVEYAFARKALSQLFPNSELVNPSNWKGSTPEEKAENVRNKLREALQDELEKACLCLEEEGGEEVCFACGERRLTSAMVIRRKDKMPLLEGIVNFYPAWAYGTRLCGLCALALRFLPLSVLRTGSKGRLWLLHTQALPVATVIAQRYGWQHFNTAIARNEPLDFFSTWETTGETGAVLYLLFELLDRFGEQLREVYKRPLPTTAYIFSNDNRKGFVQAIPVPHPLMIFLLKLQLESRSAYKRFWIELLQVSGSLRGKERQKREKFVKSVAWRLLHEEAILRQCLDDEKLKVWGGWLGHRLYLQEVRGMSTEKLAILERLGLVLTQSNDTRKHIIALKTARWNELYGLLLSYVRQGWLKHDEFYLLLPPNDYEVANEVRDILLAVMYEWQWCQERGLEFPKLKELPTVTTSDETLTRLQEIGRRLVEELPNLQRWIGRLQTARSSFQIRGAYLQAVERGALSFQDFVFLAPLGDVRQLWLLRDYLLAYLFECARQELPEEALVSAEPLELEGGET